MYIKGTVVITLPTPGIEKAKAEVLTQELEDWLNESVRAEAWRRFNVQVFAVLELRKDRKGGDESMRCNWCKSDKTENLGYVLTDEKKQKQTWYCGLRCFVEWFKADVLAKIEKEKKAGA